MDDKVKLVCNECGKTWKVTKAYFEDNFAELEPPAPAPERGASRWQHGN